MIESNDLYKVIPWAKEAGLELSGTAGGGLLYRTKDGFWCPCLERWLTDGTPCPDCYVHDREVALKSPPPYPPGFTPTYKLASGPRMDNIGYTDVKDSGVRQSFSTGSRRDTREGKGRFDLMPPKALRRLARHFENGAKKYGDRNWEKGQPQSRFMDSALRHLNNYLDGHRDEDHLSAAAWNVLCMIHQEERFAQGWNAELNDLPADSGVSLGADVGVPGREPSVVPKDDKDLEGDVTDR